MFLLPVRPFRFLFLCLSSFFLLVLAFPTTTFAARLHATDTITITSQTSSLHFPTAIDFQMSVVDTGGTITGASIFLILGTQQTSFQEQHTISAKHPASAVTLSWHEDTSKRENFVPPGATVSYYWQVQDSTGNVHTDVTQKFTMIDNRFPWQNISQGFLHVDWYGHSTDFGQQILDKAEQDITHISSVLGGGLQQPINLWVYATNSDFHGSLPPGTFEWVGGVALPSLNQASIVVQYSSDLTLVRDMPHELTHLVFHQLIASYNDVPTWFDEGLAVYNQLYHEPEMNQVFQTALQTHTILPLSTLTDGFPADASKATLAYAESWNLLQYMYDTFGQERMKLLVKDLKDPNHTFNQDLGKALGFGEIAVENQWLLSLHQPLVPFTATATPTPVPAQQISPSVGNSNSWLLCLGFLLVLVGIGGIVIIGSKVRQARQRAKQKAWAIEAAQQIIASSLSGTSGGSYTQGNPRTHRFSWEKDHPQAPPYTSPATYRSPQEQLPSKPQSPQSPQPPRPVPPVRPSPDFGIWPGSPPAPSGTSGTPPDLGPEEAV